MEAQVLGRVCVMQYFVSEARRSGSAFAAARNR
jgi:hypothetical protein